MYKSTVNYTRACWSKLKEVTLSTETGTLLHCTIIPRFLLFFRIFVWICKTTKLADLRKTKIKPPTVHCTVGLKSHWKREQIKFEDFRYQNLKKEENTKCLSFPQNFFWLQNYVVLKWNLSTRTKTITPTQISLELLWTENFTTEDRWRLCNCR